MFLLLDDIHVLTDTYESTLNMQMHPMLLSTAYNSLATVLANLYHSFSEVAQKSYQYIKSLPPGKQPAEQLIIRACFRTAQKEQIPAGPAKLINSAIQEPSTI